MKKRFQSLLVLVFVSCILSSIAFASILTDTGQTKCYNSNGTASETACEGSGQDGAYIGSAMSYTDNGNGTVTDNVTGLVWQKLGNSKTASDLLTWEEANTYCNNLNLGGRSGWRLPSKREFVSLVDYSIPYQGPVINISYFPNTNGKLLGYSFGYYWIKSSNNSLAMDFTFGDYVDSSSAFGNAAYVRCVNGSKNTPSFTDNRNGTVTDNVTSLMWQQDEKGVASWAKALTYCEGLSLGGHTDWRLPNIKELESITDENNITYSQSLDTNYFMVGLSTFKYWSSTTSATNAMYAWFLDIGNGEGIYDGGGKLYEYSYARCVRTPGGDTIIAVNNCAATLSSDNKLHIPILTYNGQSYWADLKYTSGSNFTLSNAGTVTDTSSYSGCTAATLSSSYNLHIPALTYNNVSYWADFQYVPDATFTLTGAAAN